MFKKTITSLFKSFTKLGPRFKDNGNGTVTDTLTGLIWLKNANPCPDGLNWTDAVAYCGLLASGTGGLQDWSSPGMWRLPTKEELEGLGTQPPCVWDAGYPPTQWSLPGEPFINVRTDYYYWSSTVCEGSIGNVWAVYMYDGLVSKVKKSYSNFYVWPVRNP